MLQKLVVLTTLLELQVECIV